jgi:RHS repeat-associated protein
VTSTPKTTSNNCGQLTIEDSKMKRLVRLSLPFFLVLFNAVSFAQDATNARFTTGEANDSANLSVSVPFGNYKGRGISLPVGLTYSPASLWRFERIGDVRDYNLYPPSGVKQTITQAIFSEYSTAGWKSSLDLPIVEWPKDDEFYKHTGQPTFTNSCAYRLHKVFIHMPDGSVHELREDDNAFSATSGVDMSGTFYAVDGSRLRYDSTDIDTGTLYLPDGTRYVLDAGDGDLIDRNGNTASYSSSTREWTDTLGRTIPNPIPASPMAGTTTHVNLPGLSGVSPSGLQTYDLKWEYLADVLTPVGGSTPNLSYVASDYLPTPSLAPTSSNSYNYPQPRPTASPVLFHSAYNEDDEGNPSLAPTVALGKGQGQTDLFNPVVLSEIDLPDGTKYQFTYNVYGEITKVIYPTNSYEQYEYEMAASISDGITRWPYDSAKRRLKSRKLSVDGSSGSDIAEWKYSDESVGIYRTLKIIAPDNTRTEIVTNDWFASLMPLGFQSSAMGNIVEKRAYSTSSNGLGGSLLRRELTKYDESANSYTWNSVCNTTNYSRTVVAYRNPRPIKHTTILFEGSGSALAQTTTYSYDTTYQYSTGVDQTQENVYGFAVISNTSTSDTAQAGGVDDITTGSLARYTVTTYSSNSTYRDANILGLPTVVEVKDSGGTVVSRSEMSYDESGYVPSSTTRGLPTTMKTWDSTKGASTNSSAYLTTHATFDDYGNRTVATDAKGYTTTTTYDSTYHVFPLSVTSPVPDSGGTRGSTSGFTTSATYDVPTGLVLTTTDVNGQTSTMEYNDDLLRPTKVTAPNGQETVTEYGAGTDASSRWVKVKTQIDADHWSEAKSFYDGVGRTLRTQKTETAGTAGDIHSLTCYDSMGRVSKSTNPFNNYSTQTCSTTSGLEWTTPEYDDLSRTTKVTAPDTREVQISYGLSTSGVIGTTKTITDQAGKKRKGIVDALGNMVRVIEDPDSSALATDYVFDVLGNLRKTTQGDQNRYFMYDSLGRVLYARQVEQDANSAFSGSGFADPITSNNQWSTKYTYDDNGNIATTTNSRNLSITATYDHLNRLTTRDYSDSAMPDTDLYYDGTGLGSVPSYSKGKTTKVTSSVSENRNTSFDSMGRLLTSEQRTDGQTYAFGYTYNLSGALIEETYPSGRVVKNTVDSDGKLQQVQSKKCLDTTLGTSATCTNSGGYWAYANSFTYDKNGTVTKMQLGNGRWENAVYNDRGQVTQIGLGTTDSAQDILKLDFEYEGASPSTTVADRNNGSLRKQTITVPTVGSYSSFTAVQTYAYDNLNRIQSATETVSSTQTWKQTFDIDRYGNRRFDTNSSNTTTIPSGCSTAICNPTFDTVNNNNRFATSQGYAYDADGNITQDASGQRFAYDSENRQIAFFGASNSGSTPDATYYYDGEGNRVKKVVGNGTTVFVYDASSRLVAEYSTPVEGYAPYFGQVGYVTADQLGSTRIITDQNGAVTARKDFTAYGETVISSQRVEGNGYGGPPIRQDYTGYQKDSESLLEYAQARYYNLSHGRFTSVDPLPSSAAVRDPQSFNRYSYALNSPYKFTDPLGLFPMGGGACGHGRCVQVGGGDWFSDGSYYPSLRPASAHLTAGARGDSQPTGQQPAAGQPATPPQPSAEQNTTGNQSSSDSSAESGFKTTSALGANVREQALLQLAITAPQVAYVVGRDLVGDAVKDSASPIYNCLAWALGITNSWVQPGRDGISGPLLMVDRTRAPGVVRDTIDGNYSASTAPDVFGYTRQGHFEMPNMRLIRVFEDSAQPRNWHVMRREQDGTWTSKNGTNPLFANIRNPDLFYRVHYQPKGRVTTTDYLIPKH